MGWFLASGGAGGSAGAIEVRDDYFFGSDAERDTYFASNPDELLIDIYVSSNGVLQKYNGTTWLDYSQVVRGQQGDSAYQVWVNQGNVGTVTDFLNNINGADGASAYNAWLGQGNAGTEADFVDSLVGADGKSAYQSWLDQGNAGTESEFVNGLQGEDAPQFMIQYSPDGNDGWVDPVDFNSVTHKYWRWSTDGGATWSANNVRFTPEAAAGSAGLPAPFNAAEVGGKLRYYDGGIVMSEHDDTGIDFKVPLTKNGEPIYSGENAAIAAADLSALTGTDRVSFTGLKDVPVVSDTNLGLVQIGPTLTADADGVINVNQNPTQVEPVADEAAMLAFAQSSNLIIAIRQDTAETFALKANDDPSVLANWKKIGETATDVLSFNGRTGSVTPEVDDYNLNQVKAIDATLGDNKYTFYVDNDAAYYRQVDDVNGPVVGVAKQLTVKAETDAVIADLTELSNIVGADDTEGLRSRIKDNEDEIAFLTGDIGFDDSEGVKLRVKLNENGIDAIFGIIGATSSTGLQGRVGNIESDIGTDDTEGLRLRVANSETAIGDETSGLTKQIADLEVSVGTDDASGLRQKLSEVSYDSATNRFQQAEAPTAVAADEKDILTKKDGDSLYAPSGFAVQTGGFNTTAQSDTWQTLCVVGGVELQFRNPTTGNSVARIMNKTGNSVRITWTTDTNGTLANGFNSANNNASLNINRSTGGTDIKTFRGSVSDVASPSTTVHFVEVHMRNYTGGISVTGMLSGNTNA